MFKDGEIIVYFIPKEVNTQRFNPKLTLHT